MTSVVALRPEPRPEILGADISAPGKSRLDRVASAAGFILRSVSACGLPQSLRLSVGSEEANRVVIAALGEFVRGRRRG